MDTRKPAVSEESGSLSILQLVREQTPTSQQQPLLTVVVCAYRHDAYIEECLASVNSAATNVSLELLVIDDGSPDDTLARCLAFEFRDDLPVRIYTKPNHGLVHSLRCGLELARGKYLAVIASDDCYVSGGLEMVAGVLASGQARGGILCQAVYMTSDGGTLNGSLVYGDSMTKLFQASPSQRFAALCTQFPKPLLLQASIFETGMLRQSSVWRDGMDLDDWPAFIHVFKAEAQGLTSLGYRPDIVLCRYRQHPEGAHNRLDRQLKLTEQVALNLVPEIYRAECLANVRIDIGLIHLHGGNLRGGLSLCLRGLLTAPKQAVVRRLLGRAMTAIGKRLRAAPRTRSTH